MWTRRPVRGADLGEEHLSHLLQVHPSDSLTPTSSLKTRRVSTRGSGGKGRTSGLKDLLGVKILLPTPSEPISTRPRVPEFFVPRTGDTNGTRPGDTEVVVLTVPSAATPRVTSAYSPDISKTLECHNILSSRKDLRYRKTKICVRKDPT